jgi:hypothetical protein
LSPRSPLQYRRNSKQIAVIGGTKGSQGSQSSDGMGEGINDSTHGAFQVMMVVQGDMAGSVQDELLHRGQDVVGLLPWRRQRCMKDDDRQPPRQKSPEVTGCRHLRRSLLV